MQNLETKKMQNPKCITKTNKKHKYRKAKNTKATKWKNGKT